MSSEESSSFLPLDVPLRKEESGAIRVGKTRVLLELVIWAFRDGATPDEIVQRYSTLDLADVYAVLAWCLRHGEMVDMYLRKREEYAESIQKKIES